MLSALGARQLLGGVYAVDQGITRLEQGGFSLSAEIIERLERSLQELTETLPTTQPAIS
ncbi:hypothetical protein D3C85_1795370 [compost metagenome]